jgi:CDP-diacylglycerol--glycerol-3-phosphate 3-phosphatidyltransferase
MNARPSVWNLPNILTAARIAITPVVAALPFIDGYWPKLACFVVFVTAAVTDVIDGRIARRDNLITDLGKTLDPLADKLLLLATLGPIWYISQQRQTMYDIPVWGSIPL